MSYKSKIILSQQYKEPDLLTSEFYGEPESGDGFYGKSDGLHTIQYSISNFVGTLLIQATICYEPTETDWFTVIENEYELLDETISNIENFIGNYVWIRAVLKNWTHGTVNVIRMNH